jgi:predicted ribosomally synthesized peptide with nif11-like leader
MSVQNAAAFLGKVEADADLSAQVQSPADAVRIGAEQNTPFTLEELEQAQAQRLGELTPEDMQNVAGGRMNGPFL